MKTNNNKNSKNNINNNSNYYYNKTTGKWMGFDLTVINNMLLVESNYLMKNKALY